MSDFARLAAADCPTHEELALGLAAELLGEAAAADAHQALGALAAGLPRVAGAQQELGALAELAAEHLAPRAGGPVLLPGVLRDGGGHPLGVAIALAAAGARAGYGTGLVGHHDRLYVTHPEGVLVVDPVACPALVDARTLGADLHWRCAHETADLALRRAGRAAERSGDLALALGASALGLVLLVDDETREGRHADHLRLLSRLN